ncbi:MAG: DEAD/DEAH box helicase, partial [Acidithiobacillus sp.]|nr:DEAD/DEAH box helicase [Acidithiobacillus sp.]
LSRDELEKGKKFERMIAQYLLTDPEYANRLASVWLWEDWPDRWQANNTGIDLVAQERDTGNYWAIQCKFYDPSTTIKKEHVDSFIADANKVFDVDGQERRFSYCLIVSTSDKWGKNAEAVTERQSIPVYKLYINELADSPVNWDTFRIDQPQVMTLRPKKVLREHQEEAIKAVQEGFQTVDRGKLIMACGTGKTFTSLRLVEKITPEDGIVLFLAPSIYLVSQTLREWSAEALSPFHAFVVCSDSKVGREEEDIRIEDLAYPATTDPKKLIEAINGVCHDRRTVIFSTYQSIQAVIDAQKLGALPAFDLVICDEAHRTTGLTLPTDKDASDFVKVHENHLIRARKRLYMTATPRIYNDNTKTKAGKKEAVLYSMDDEAIFGPELYRLSFGKAVSKDLLSEYKVLIVAVDSKEMSRLANDYNEHSKQNRYRLNDKEAIDIPFATKIIGSWKGLSKLDLKIIDEEGNQQDLVEDTQPMRRAVAFSKSIKGSEDAVAAFSDLVRLYREGETSQDLVDCKLVHVDGKMNAAVRKNALDWLKEATTGNECRILSNARCLSEGVDVPALDAVIFFDTRDSIVDIVQSVGRVMRKAPGKKHGYIILPVAIPTDKVKDYNTYIESDGQFKGIWKVIKALRAHDERLVDEAEFRRRVRVRGGSREDKEDRDKKKTQGDLVLDYPVVPVGRIEEAVYAAIPKKLGDREYWADWAKHVAQIAENLVDRIEDLIQRRDGGAAFRAYLKGLRKNINPSINEGEAIDMLAQHIITRPVFDALFEGHAFTRENPISQAMQRIVEVLDKHDVDSETEDLEKFYQDVRERVALAKSDKSRQDVIKNLYDTFFNSAFPRMAERLGIVYTPVEAVDFIVHSVDAVLKKHFQAGISDRGVQIIDPFTGTGTFLVRLLQSGLIRQEDLLYKYQNELHANEIVLLAYYIAAVNIETAFHARTGEYLPFDGIVLTDTFQMDEPEQGSTLDAAFSRENTERVERQKAQPIRVVFGNPPYSGGQESANDNNQNQKYPRLDARIEATYAAKSSGTNKNSLYATEIKALRWASDRIKNEGVVAFVTNNKFIGGNIADGLRKCIAEEFSYAYLFDLRGAIRGRSGDEAKREGQSIFNIMTGIALVVLVKDPAHEGPCELYYHDIGDYLDREEKLANIEQFGSIENIPWQKIIPNEAGDWINQRNPEFEGFIPLGDKADKDAKTIFETYSGGVKTSRDDWAYNFSRQALESNMRRMIDNYNNEVERYAAAYAEKSKLPDVDDIVDGDPKKIKWSRGLKADAERGRKYDFEDDSVVLGIYRPFTKSWC